MAVIPKWLDRHLNAKGAIAIENAVRQAESRTSGEIVPLVVRRSSVTGHTGILAALICLCLILCLEFAAIDLGLWTLSPWRVTLTALVAMIGGYLAALLPSVRRLLTPRVDQNTQAFLRASLEFNSHKLDDTAQRTGIMLFVSFDEHQVVILADEGIASKLPDDTWTEVLDLLLRGIRQKNMAAGFVDAVSHCGAILAAHFPATGTNPNELTDKLIIKD